MTYHLRRNQCGWWIVRYPLGDIERAEVLSNIYLLNKGTWHRNMMHYSAKRTGYFNSRRWAIQVFKKVCPDCKLIEHGALV